MDSADQECETTRDACPGTSTRWRPVAVDGLIVMVCGVAAMLVIAWWSASGSMMTLDSFSYFAVAGHVRDGLGLTSPFPPLFSDLPFSQQLAHDGRIPLTQWQPGFPVLLAAVSSFGLSAGQAARSLAIVGAGVMTASVVLVGRRVLRWPVVPVVMLAVLFITRPNRFELDVWLFGASGMAMTEVISISLTVAAIVIAQLLLERQTTASTGVLAAMTCILVMIRPEGIVFGVAILVVGLWFGRSGRPGISSLRVRHALAPLVAGCLTYLVWQRMNRLLWGATPTVRSPAWHWSVSVFPDTIAVMSGWFMGIRIAPTWLQVVVVMAGVVAPIAVTLVPSWHRRVFPSRDRLGRFAVLCTVMIVGQWVLVLATRWGLDRTTDVSARYLLSSQPFCYLLIATVFISMWRNLARPHHRARQIRWGALGAVSLAWIAMVGPVVSKASDAREGMRRANKTQAEAPSVQVDRGVAIVTNSPEVMWQTNRTSVLMLPRTESVTSGKENSHFDDEVDRVADFARRRAVAVVTIRTIPGPELSGRAALMQLERRHGFVQAVGCGSRVRVWAYGPDRAFVAARTRCIEG